MQKKKKFSPKELLRILCQEQFETFAAWDGWEIPFLDAFVILASYIQVLSLSLSPNYGISNGPYLLQIIFYVARPSGYLVTQTDTVHVEMLIISLVCLISLVVLHVFLSKHSIFRARLNYFLTFFNAYFLVILLEIGYAQLLPYFNSSDTTDSESPVRAIFGVLLIIISQLVSAFLCIFCEPNVRIYEVGLSRLSLSRTHSVSHILKHISVGALYIQYEKQVQCSAILLIIGIVILFSAAHDQRRHFPFSSLLKNQANSSGIAILAIGLILLTAIRECFELMSDTTSVILFLMSIPPAMKLACDYSETKFYYLIFVRWVRNTIPLEMEPNYQDLGFSTAQNSINPSMYTTNTLTMSMNAHINENDPDAGDENLTQFNDVFYFPLQLAYFARNRKNLARDPNTKVMLLSAYQSHISKCKNKSTCQCTVLNKVGGVQEGRFAVLLDLQQNFLHQNAQHLLLSKRYLQTPSFQQAFFSMASYLISLNKNIFCLQRVIELLSQKKAMTLNRQFERGVWFKSGLEVFLKIIQDSMDTCFLSDVDQNKDVYNTFKACQLFFKVEQVKQKNLLHVIDIVKTKIDVLKRVKSGVKDMQELKKINEAFQIVCEKCERSLTTFYEKVPTRDNQSLLCFFLSEVKSDLKKAQDIMGKRQFSNSLDMNLLLGTNTLMQVFSNAVHSIRAGFAKGSGALLWYSNALPKFLGYSSQEFHYFQKVNDLLPHVLAFYHDDLVTEVKDFERIVFYILIEIIWPLLTTQYLKAGESSEVFQNLKFGYLRHFMGWIQPVQMFININFMDLSQIGFFVFIQKQNALISTNEYILLDEDGQFCVEIQKIKSK